VKDIETIEDAIDKLSAVRKEMILEKEELQDLKEEIADYQEDLQLLEQVIKESGSKKVKVCVLVILQIPIYVLLHQLRKIFL
jgi:hypothetical protein